MQDEGDALGRRQRLEHHQERRPQRIGEQRRAHRIADGLANLLHLEAAERGLLALGYPAYFGTLIGAWKILGGVALLAPGRPRLKEWAYAGIVFDLTGALFSHLAAGDPAVKCLGATVYLALTITSWAMRPPSRVLGTLPAFGIFHRPCHSQERRLV